MTSAEKQVLDCINDTVHAQRVNSKSGAPDSQPDLLDAYKAPSPHAGAWLGRQVAYARTRADTAPAAYPRKLPGPQNE